MARSRSSRTVVGLDLEADAVCAVEAKPGPRPSVVRAVAGPLPPNVVRDGEVADVDALANALRTFFRDRSLGRRVRLGVANSRIVVRTIDLPPLTDRKELTAAVRFTAQDQIPMPLDQAVLDFATLGLVETPEGPRMRTVVVAARRDMIEKLLEAVRQAGLRPEGIDLAAFALVRALAPTDGDAAPVLIAHVGGVVNLALAQGANCLFTRVGTGGIEDVAAELAERRALTLEHARGWLEHVGLLAPLETVEGDPEIVAEARGVLTEGARRVAGELRNSLDFLSGMELPQPDRVLLSGPALSVPGFVEAIDAQIELPVEAATPAEAAPGALGDVAPGRAAIAAGLAVEERTA